MKRRIRALIVDDEPLARDAVRVMLGEDPDVEVVAECRDGREAVAAIREHAPDMVFLDVQMPGLDGFGVVERVGVARMPVTVFVTAYDHYALRAFAAHALDYLLKPFDHQRFADALRRAKNHVRLQHYDELSGQLIALLGDLQGRREEPVEEEPPRPKYVERLAVKAGGRIVLLHVGEIDWVEAAGDYLRLHAGSRAHTLRGTMSELASRLDPEKFLRIHRSTVVNVERVQDIQPLFKGEHLLTLRNGTQLKVSRGYRDKLQSLLGRSS